MNEKEAVAPAFIRVQQPLPLLQQLVQFIINGFDVRADNDLTGVLPRTDDACCACRFYSLLIDLTVVLDLKAQAGSAVAGAYYDLAAHAELKPSTISTWYNDNAIPTIPSLVKICDAFQITLSEFFAKAEGSESAPVSI